VLADYVPFQIRRLIKRDWTVCWKQTIQIIWDAAHTTLYQKIMTNSYQERRKPFIIYTYDGSHNKHGKKGFHNWIILPMKQINFPWINLPIPISNLLSIFMNFWHNLNWKNFIFLLQNALLHLKIQYRVVLTLIKYYYISCMMMRFSIIKKLKFSLWVFSFSSHWHK